MSSLLSTLARTVILDDAAYQEWRERPNLFLRGIVLILIVTLVAGLVVFAVNLVDRVQPVDAAKIEGKVREAIELQMQWNPSLQAMDPEDRAMFDKMIGIIIPMAVDIANIEAPLPQGIVGFFQATGAWLTRALAAIAGWLFYGALVLIVVNLLGGSAKLPDFLGMVSLYSVPALLGLLTPIPCVGPILGFVGMIWSIVVYIKAISVATDLDAGRSILAAVAPLIIVFLLGLLLLVVWVIWLVILF